MDVNGSYGTALRVQRTHICHGYLALYQNGNPPRITILLRHALLPRTNDLSRYAGGCTFQLSESSPHFLVYGVFDRAVSRLLLSPSEEIRKILQWEPLYN
jgi:hypothetical protein